jgi:hypothetical protein
MSAFEGEADIPDPGSSHIGRARNSERGGARFGVRLLFVSEDGVAQICKKRQDFERWILETAS